MKQRKCTFIVPKKIEFNFQADFDKLGELIGSYRMNRGILQSELAKMIGVSRRTMTRIENNKIPLSIEMLFKIATVFRVRPEYLLNELTRIAGCKWDKSGEE